MNRSHISCSRRCEEADTQTLPLRPHPYVGGCLVALALLITSCATTDSKPLPAASAAQPPPAAPVNAAKTGAPPRYFDVRAFGAIGDGKTLDSPAINKA